MTGTATILRGNALDLPLADASVDLIVTSPPYFGLRSYQDGGEHYAGQIGSEATPAEFVDALLAATAEMVRVLKPSGSLWVNLGDKYSSAGGSDKWIADPDAEAKRRGVGKKALREDAGFRRSGAWGIPNKSLMGIPWRYALACIDQLGLILRAEVIWAKPNGLPESVTDRVRRSHEQWFHFVKQPRYFSAIDEIREEHAGEFLSSGVKNPRYGRPGGQMPGRRAGEPDLRHEALGSQGNYFTAPLNPLGKLPGSVWTIPTQPLTAPPELGVDHFAAFPMEWPRRIIQGWSPSGVCTACGEGRRPVTEASRTLDGIPVAGIGGWKRGGVQEETAGVGNWRFGTSRGLVGYACACTPTRVKKVPTVYHDPRGYDEVTEYAWDEWDPPPTTPAVVLDPFGGTGTVALVAKALRRHGISLDMSADYCRLAAWRTTDEGEYARALQVEKPAKQVDGQMSLLEAWA
jgi:DNA modification methylase